MTTATRSPRRHDALLVKQSVIGDFAATAPRPALHQDPVLRWGRPALLPFSSLMRVATTDRVCALTYDDGPEPDDTPALLDELAKHDVRATFFVLSDRAEAHPAIIHRMIAEGHEVGVHGIDHSDLTAVSAREAARRLRLAKARIEGVTSRPARYYRPTYGALGLSGLLAARWLGMDIIIWSAWAEDWFDAPAPVIADRALRALHPGAVLLLHDTTDQPDTPGSRPRPSFSRAHVARLLLEGAEATGFRFMPVGDLLHGRPAVRALTVRRPRLTVRRLGSRGSAENVRSSVSPLNARNRAS